MAVLTLPTIVLAQQEPSRTIQAVQINGLERMDAGYVRDVVRVRAGDPLDEAVLDAAVRRLLGTGRFVSARYDLTEQDDGVRVDFELRERTVVTAIRFEGNAKYNDGKLREQIAVKEGQPIDWFTVREGRDTISALYRDAGYGDVDVSFDREHIERTGEVVYRIEEGLRVRVRKIEFEGNTAFTVGRLKRQIDTKTALWVLRSGAFDEDQVEIDAASLRRFYREDGFLDTKVSYRRELSEDGQDISLIFTIAEGTRYVIEDIQFQGLSAFSPEEFLAIAASRVGGIVRSPLVEADARQIQSKYWELGYIYATVRPIRVFSDEPGLVRVNFQIEEGDQYRVGEVRVRGNTRTKDKVVRRALNLYPPDDLLDLNEAKTAERRLLETRIFSSARVFPTGDDPGRRDVEIHVEEAERSGDFLFGVGVTSNSGFVGSIVLDLKNFDLFDYPRDWKEFIKFRSFFGGGQRLRLEFLPGTDVNRYRVDFTEPYLADRQIRLDTSLYLFDREREGYMEQRGGFMISLGKRFERGLLHNWSGELALRIGTMSIDDVDLFASSEIRDEEGRHLLTSLKTSMVRDRTDSRFIPTTGDRLRVSYEQYLGDYTFGRLAAGYSWYKTLRVDPLERKSVLHLRAEGGVIVGDAPVTERFYAGGTGSIRGFAFRGVGPRDGIDDNNIGGDMLALFGAEYSVPVYGDNLRGHVFLDTGTVGSGAWRAAVGVGVRLTINILGPLPLELNFALPFASDSDDDTQVFSFVVGGLF